MKIRFYVLILLILAGSATAQAPQTVTVELREVDFVYPSEAVVEAVRQATVAAQVSGRIIDVRVDAGQRVGRGQLLMRIDAREATEGNAAAQAQLAQAMANYERAKNLFGQKFVSAAALDRAEADLKSARATVGASNAGVSHAMVTAPIEGLVAQRHAELGELASPGKPLVTVFDPRGLRLVAQVPQNKLAEVRRSGRARVEFPDSGRWLEAVRVEVLPTLDARSHTVTARVTLPEGEGIFPGMAARVHFVTGKALRLTLPPAALLRRGELTAVYVIDAQGQPRLRQVRLGEALGDGSLEVVAGLAVGERVSLEPIKSGIVAKQPRR